MAAEEVRRVLSELGMHAYKNNFLKEKIDALSICKGLADSDLIRLGLTTIGERIRFREAVRIGVSAGGTDTADACASLFRPSRSRYQQSHSSSRPASKRKTRTWTGQFVCLAEKNAEKVPSSTQKVILQKAGLGLKSVQFLASDSETVVQKQLMDEFENLSNAGGFELMRCQSNCRRLEKVQCKWDVPSLKLAIGYQAKIYIRPIQSDLCIEPIEQASHMEIKAACSLCKEDILIIRTQCGRANLMPPRLISFEKLDG